MSQLELRRVRLQTLTRVLSKKGNLTLLFDDTSSTDLNNVKLRLVDGEIVPGVIATKAESWVAMKAMAAHESAHIRFTKKGVWCQAMQHSNLMAHLTNIIEDARIERCMSNLYPGTLVWFRFLNDYIFLNKKDWGIGPDALMSGLASYAVVGRLPLGIREQKDVAALVYRCGPHIDMGRRAMDTETVLESAREVFEIVRGFLESYLPPPLSDTMGSPEPEKAPGGELDPRRKPLITPDAEEPGNGPKEPQEEPMGDNSKTCEPAPCEHDPCEDSPAKPIDNDRESEQQEGTGGTKSASDSETGFRDEETKAGDHATGHEKADKDSDETGTGEYKDNNEDDKSDGLDGEVLDSPEHESGEHKESSGSDDCSADEKSDTGDVPDEEKGKCGDSGDHIDGCESINMADYSALINEAGEELSVIESATVRSEKEEARKATPEIGELEITGALSKGVHRGCVFARSDLKTTGSARLHYENMYSDVKPYINKTVSEMQKVLEYKTTLIEKNLRKGMLHGNSLWKLQAKNPRLFYQVNEPNDVPKLTIYLLVDCSGSMARGRNMTEAKKAACLLYETCVSLKIPVNITGFTSEIGSPFNVNHYRVVAFEGDYEKRHSISLLEAKRQNRDGYSIRVATKELQLRSEQKILIVLSDGIPEAPYLGYLDIPGVNDTALAVREAEKQEIGVIGLYFGPAEYLKQAQKIYNNCIYVSNISVLPLVIGRVLKKIIASL